jgi:chromosome segregation ATPase
MPPNATSNADLDDDWEAITTPFALSPDSLANLQLAFHDDDSLQSAYTLLHQRLSHLFITDDVNMVEALQLVLASSEQSTHNLTITRAAREDLLVQMAENTEWFVFEIRERDREIGRLENELKIAARDVVFYIQDGIQRQNELKTGLEGWKRYFEDLFGYQRDLIDRLANAEIALGKVAREIGEFERRVGDLEGENAGLQEVQRELLDQGRERDGEIERLRRECEERGEENERARRDCGEMAELLADMAKMNESNKTGKGKGKVHAGVQVDMYAKPETDAKVDKKAGTGKEPMWWYDSQFDDLERFF